MPYIRRKNWYFLHGDLSIQKNGIPQDPAIECWCSPGNEKKTPKAAVDSECLKAAVGLLTYISGTWHKESCTWLLLFVTIFSLKNCFSTFYQANMKWHQFHMNFWPVPLFIHQSGDANFGWSDDHPIPIIFWWSRDVETRHISIWLVVKKPSWKKILSMGFG